MASAVLAVNLLIASCILSCLAIICFAAGLVGNIWWVIETNVNKEIRGLWKTCIEVTNGDTTCVTRDDIFSFNDKRGPDPIMLCMSLSGGVALISVLLSIGMLGCCRHKPESWLKTIKWNVMFGIVSVVSIVDAMLYTEIEFYDLFQISTRGWCYYVSWIGTGFQVIAFILLIAQLCLKPRIPVQLMTQAWNSI